MSFPKMLVSKVTEVHGRFENTTIRVSCTVGGKKLSFEVKQGVGADSVYLGGWWIASKFTGAVEHYSFNDEVVGIRDLDQELIKEVIAASRRDPEPPLSIGKITLHPEWVKWKMAHDQIEMETAIHRGYKRLAGELTGYNGRIDWRLEDTGGSEKIVILSVGHKPSIFDDGVPNRISNAWVEWCHLQAVHVQKVDLTEEAEEAKFREAARQYYLKKLLQGNQRFLEDDPEVLSRYRVESDERDWQILKITDTVEGAPVIKKPEIPLLAGEKINDKWIRFVMLDEGISGEEALKKASAILRKALDVCEAPSP